MKLINRANEYSIDHFCIIIKDFSVSFSRVIIVQDFETVTVYYCIQADLLCYFLWNEKVGRFNSVQSERFKTRAAHFPI